MSNLTDFDNWTETMLTWRDTCGNDNDDVGRMRECPHCADNMCVECHVGHITWCNRENDLNA